MNEVAVRYIVHDAGKAIDFYTRHLGFTVQANPATRFRDPRPRQPAPAPQRARRAGGAGQTMPDGSTPEPGGWCRIQLRFDDLEGTVRELRAAGVRFRSDIIHGRGGDQILAEDPSGNPIELFSQPA
jgi:catechol 2,3-dioxygenase-like lactoylglutathione lyase family enzyme